MFISKLSFSVLAILSVYFYDLGVMSAPQPTHLSPAGGYEAPDLPGSTGSSGYGTRKGGAPDLSGLAGGTGSGKNGVPDLSGLTGGSVSGVGGAPDLSRLAGGSGTGTGGSPYLSKFTGGSGAGGFHQGTGGMSLSDIQSKFKELMSGIDTQIAGAGGNSAEKKASTHLQKKKPLGDSTVSATQTTDPAAVQAGLQDVSGKIGQVGTGNKPKGVY